jgi:hypothetical protein
MPRSTTKEATTGQRPVTPSSRVAWRSNVATFGSLAKGAHAFTVRASCAARAPYVGAVGADGPGRDRPQHMSYPGVLATNPRQAGPSPARQAPAPVGEEASVAIPLASRQALGAKLGHEDRKVRVEARAARDKHTRRSRRDAVQAGNLEGCRRIGGSARRLPIRATRPRRLVDEAGWLCTMADLRRTGRQGTGSGLRESG